MDARLGGEVDHGSPARRKAFFAVVIAQLTLSGLWPDSALNQADLKEVVQDNTRFLPIPPFPSPSKMIDLTSNDKPRHQTNHVVSRFDHDDRSPTTHLY